MPLPSEKSEMLTVYDENLNPIGTRTRADVHENELLHQTVRLWAVQDGRIWFQQKSMDKALFPGRFDLAATGHMDPGETPEQAVLRETKEETGLDLKPGDLSKAGAMPFPFRRPDGKLDNEFANVYLYAPERAPHFRTSPEVAGLASVSLEDYDALVKSGRPATARLYRCDPDGKAPPVPTGERTCGPDDFCCLNEQEWRSVQHAMAGHGPQAQKRGRDVGRLAGLEESTMAGPGMEYQPKG